MNELLSFAGTRADHCDGYAGARHKPTPMRFVWHHILPLICGGNTVAANLVQLCDSCHITTHWLLHRLKLGLPMGVHGTAATRTLAATGYGYATLLGTVHLIPFEGGPE
jgi:HNH endonuclease